VLVIRSKTVVVIIRSRRARRARVLRGAVFRWGVQSLFLKGIDFRGHPSPIKTFDVSATIHIQDVRCMEKGHA